MGEIKMVGRLDIKGNDQIKRVYDTGGVAPTLSTMAGGNRQPKVMIAASRGRGPNNEQHLEPRRDGMTNTITSVAKDNYVVEPNLKTQLCNKLVKNGIVHGGEIANHSYTNSAQRDSLEKYIESDGRIMPTVTTRPDTLGYVEKKPIRIRKLTPKECWRLMGFDDADFNKAKASGVSDSQLYKQAGNSIVVNVLEEILKELFDGRTD